MGPFAVALTFVIDTVQCKRTDIVREGEVECFSGMPLPKPLVEQWKNEKLLVIEGFRSASEELETALDFAYDGVTEDK